MNLTKVDCPHCKNGGCYGGAYAPRPARCEDCQGTGLLWVDENGNEYAPGTTLATDGKEYFPPDDCEGWDGGDGTGPDGQPVWMVELE